VTYVLQRRWDSSVRDSEIEMGNYSVRKDRNQNGGGLFAFVSLNIAYKVSLDLIDVDIVWLDVWFPNNKTIFVGCVTACQSECILLRSLNCQTVVIPW
jgi:hypothetical protein